MFTAPSLMYCSTNNLQSRIFARPLFRHAKVRLAAIQALRVTVKIPDRAKVKGAGTSAIVDLVGFREDNVLPVAAFYGRGTTTINYLAEVREAPTVDAVLVGDKKLTKVVTVVGL